MRDSNTERIGIYKVGFIFTKEIKWVFREQSIVDVGIDALIEQSIDGNPTGQFIAAQIKTGEGNFHINNTHLTYYVSKIHRNYWLNFNVPVILIGHLPNQDETYWEKITENNLKKTNERWKLLIDKNKKLNSNSVHELTAIIEKSKSNNFLADIENCSISDLELQEIIDNCLSIDLAGEANRNINTFIELLHDKTIENQEIINEYIHLGLTEFDKRVMRSVKKFAEFMNIISFKLNQEIDDFAYHYARGIYAYEKIVLLDFHLDKNYKKLQKTIDELKSIIPAMEDAISGIKILRNSVSDLPSKYSNLKKAKIKFTETTNVITEEIQTAISMNKEFMKNIEDILN